MLKWTASAQKLNTLEMPTPTRAAATPRPQEQQQQRRQRRRATIAHNHCDKENMLPVTSTPIVAQPAALLRVRNSPLVLAPLADILNVTPESPAQSSPRTPHGRRRSVVSTAAPTPTPIGARHMRAPPNRRHSTVGFSLPPSAPLPHEYAPTLPCYAEEEYSPSAPRVLATGQELALRGLMPVPFLTTMRYFQTPEVLSQHSQPQQRDAALPPQKSRPQKRKLEQEFAEMSAECRGTRAHNVTSTTSSAKMGDQTLDRLIDAILDSARKEEKRKKPRKSFNLRRRTLLKNQTEHAQQEVLLSPSYAAGDDPASDLSFLLCETALEIQPKTPATVLRRSLTLLNATPKPQPSLALTPAPATPPPGTPIPLAVLQQMPTPAAAAFTASKTLKSLVGSANDSFSLATPVRALNKRRRHQQQPLPGATAGEGSASKKFKGEARNYFEVGLALPSIYV